MRKTHPSKSPAPPWPTTTTSVIATPRSERRHYKDETHRTSDADLLVIATSVPPVVRSVPPPLWLLRSVLWVFPPRRSEKTLPRQLVTGYEFAPPICTHDIEPVEPAPPRNGCNEMEHEAYKRVLPPNRRVSASPASSPSRTVRPPSLSFLPPLL